MNSVNLIGRLTADPEGHTTASGAHFTTMRLAIPRWSKAGEDRGAVFIDITAWGKLAALCAEHLSKGRQVAVTGRLELDEWIGRDGVKRHSHQVVADAVEFLGPRPEGPDTPSEKRSAPGARSHGAAVEGVSA